MKAVFVPTGTVKYAKLESIHHHQHTNTEVSTDQMSLPAMQPLV